jgi:hypothetical protein
MSVQDLIGRLDKARETVRRGNWTARCPAHEDKEPSLSIREEGDGRVLVHCFAGCSVEDILAAVGLEFDAIYPPEPIGVRLPPIRRPFPAADVLQAISHEMTVILICAADVRAGKPPNTERLGLAIERIEQARALANG